MLAKRVIVLGGSFLTCAAANKSFFEAHKEITRKLEIEKEINRVQRRNWIKLNDHHVKTLQEYEEYRKVHKQ